MGDRRDCSHPTATSSITVIRWCVRCSGWRYYCWAESLAEPSDTLFSWDEVTSGFWEAEASDPWSVTPVLTRILRVTQENEQNYREVPGYP
jgi:hypothetical protein